MQGKDVLCMFVGSYSIDYHIYNYTCYSCVHSRPTGYCTGVSPGHHADHLVSKVCLVKVHQRAAGVALEESNG